MAAQGARRRRSSPKQGYMNKTSNTDDTARRDEVVWGKTANGTVFRVPTTHDVLTLFNPFYPKSHLDILNLALLGLQLVLFALLPNHITRPFFLCYFVFWRAAYDSGLGWVLTKQSKRKWIVREVQRRAWLDGEKRPKMRRWIKNQLQGKMGKDYSFDELPLEYNAWLLFRQLVDIILLNDFLSYCMFAFACFRIPYGLSLGVHIMRWIGGISLIAFNLWVKTEAHHVVKDYGWYWGDCFFQRGALVFDGVFEMAPHPMYSVGYAGYYGLSLIVGSYPVLFVSLAAHAAQFAFLVFFENPHIERMYGQKKPIAQRTPLIFPTTTSGPAPTSGTSSPIPRSLKKSKIQSLHSPVCPTTTPELSTPAVTESDSESDSLLETEMDDNDYAGSSLVSGVNTPITGGATSFKNRTRNLESGRRSSSRILTQHDLMNLYFRKDVIGLSNVDLLRTSDLKLLLLVAYILLFTFLWPRISHHPQSILLTHFAHALLWRFFHSFGLGLLLRSQSENKFLVRHFITHYHYPTEFGGAREAVKEAFENWKGLYNLSLCMVYASFVGLAWQTYEVPEEWIVGDQLLRHTLGTILVGLHMWTARECYEVLGVFGWFFGDFFIEDYPATLEYTGIYRFLNSPERTMSGAAFFGLALISGSKLVFALAVISQISHWWFLSRVENPHMQKLYGPSLRREAGLTKVIKKVALKNALLFESRAGRHAPEITRVAKEMIGTFDKVYEETAEAMREFLPKPASKAIKEVVQDTKVLLRQSRERFVISRVTSDVGMLDKSKYRIEVKPGKTFHVGEPVTVEWHAPANHSIRDWVGIYRKGANKSVEVTKVSSLGMWVPVHDDEWDGDTPLHLDKSKGAQSEEMGEVVFNKDRLPWAPGLYELRYHHDGKHNVMSIAEVEIYVDKISDLTFSNVRSTLMRLVPLALDFDPSLIPLSCQPPPTPQQGPLKIESGIEIIDARDPDDFSFWSEKQAKRLAKAIQLVFDVEYSAEVIVADANLSALANRILVSKEILH